MNTNNPTNICPDCGKDHTIGALRMIYEEDAPNEPYVSLRDLINLIFTLGDDSVVVRPVFYDLANMLMVAGNLGEPRKIPSPTIDDEYKLLMKIVKFQEEMHKMRDAESN